MADAAMNTDWSATAGVGADGARGPGIALLGLPPGLADGIGLLADILGWQTMQLPAGPVMRPSARLCLAMLPPGPGEPAAMLMPLAAWSPEKNLNERILQARLSIMDQPVSVSALEQLLQLLAVE